MFIARRSPLRAIEWVDHVIERMRSLVELPHAHAVDEIDSTRANCQVRRFSIGNYAVTYRVDDAAKVVHVIAFRHAARRRDESDSLDTDHTPE